MAVIMSKQLVVPKAPVPNVAGSDLEVGSSVFLNVDGIPTEFLVVHQGLPSSLYDSSCDGTWLMMKDIYVEQQWYEGNNVTEYESSAIHSYMNNTFLNLIDEEIREQIKTVKIPYVYSDSSVCSGSDGLSTRIFLLSGCEVGYSGTGIPVDGAALSFFSGNGNSNSNRVANLNGEATRWWLRSPDIQYSTRAWHVETDGSSRSYFTQNAYGCRPALILPYNAMFDPDTMEFIGAGDSSGSGDSGGSGGSGDSGDSGGSGETVTVTISGYTASTRAYALINGAKITATGSTEYEKPLEITVHVGKDSDASGTPKINLNGANVAVGFSDEADYTFVTEADAVTINFTRDGTLGTLVYCYSADITET